MVDQIRVYQQSMYDFEVDVSIQGAIQQRIQQLGQQDLAVLATQQQANIQRIQNKRGHGAFKRMRQRFQAKHD
jgi:hypothetical protein